MSLALCHKKVKWSHCKSKGISYQGAQQYLPFQRKDTWSYLTTVVNLSVQIRKQQKVESFLSPMPAILFLKEHMISLKECVWNVWFWTKNKPEMSTGVVKYSKMEKREAVDLVKFHCYCIPFYNLLFVDSNATLFSNQAAFRSITCLLLIQHHILENNEILSIQWYFKSLSISPHIIAV